MVIIIYSAQSEKSIQANIGTPDYSYYFVLKKFRPVISKFATVIEIRNPRRDVDIIYNACQKRQEPCLFLSFTPPFKTVVGLKCPTISVFAWEFTTIPTETWNNNPLNDWRNVFRQHGRAITHSSFAVKTVRKAMGDDFPIWSIPAPLWNDFVAFYDKEKAPMTSSKNELIVDGIFCNLNGCETTFLPGEKRAEYAKQHTFPENGEKSDNVLHLRKIVYTAVLNPFDLRKNWDELVKGYIWALREKEDVTLLIKAVHYDAEAVIENMVQKILMMTPFTCQVIILCGYLKSATYLELIRKTTFVVNTAHGEGQCLPLMEFMSAGKPAIAPHHTAMEDYINADNAFIVESSLERGHWPDDPRIVSRTMHYRPDWETIYHAYQASYHVAKNEPDRYARMADCAVESLRKYCSREVVEERLKLALRHVGALEEDLHLPDDEKILRELQIPLARIKFFQIFANIDNFLKNTISDKSAKILHLLKRRLRDAL